MATASYDTAEYTGPNPFLNALIWDDRWDQGSGPVTYAFGWQAGGAAWTGPEKAAFAEAFAAFSEVADLDFARMTNVAGANLSFYVSRGDPGYFAAQSGPFGEPPAGDGDGFYFRGAHADWSGQLAPGGYAFVTILHELGHALGLAHPHDRGGSSGVFPRPRSGQPDPDTGIYTVMSYDDLGLRIEGSPVFPDEQKPYGFAGGLMAFDIAAIQTIYGRNTDHASGDDAYALPGANAVGTNYRCVWDTAGLDAVTYSGARDCTIDLRAASLHPRDDHAGGRLSRVEGVFGGFTIANGVVIENAAGGSGHDRLIGNFAGNGLTGGAGADLLAGRNGRDWLVGGAGRDSFLFDTALNGRRNVDRIDDFSAASDTVRLDDAVFTGLKLGFLAADAFAIGTAAADAEDRIVYDIRSGTLLFDANGSAAGGGTRFATLDAGLALTAADFLVV